MIFSFYPQCNTAINIVAASQEVFVACSGIESKNCSATFYAIPGFITVLKLFVFLIIEIVSFNMSSKFTEVTFNSFILCCDIFCTDSAWKL